MYVVLIALAIALLFTSILSMRGKKNPSWSSFWAFFLILFLTVWATGLYIIPKGPVYRGVAWLPLLLSGILLTLLIIAITPDQNNSSQQFQREESGRVRESPEKLGESEDSLTERRNAFFWTLIIFLLVIISIGLVF